MVTHFLAFFLISEGFLSGLTRLEYLHIFGAKLDNVDAISSMSGLICINLQNCGMTSAKLSLQFRLAA